MVGVDEIICHNNMNLECGITPTEDSIIFVYSPFVKDYFMAPRRRPRRTAGASFSQDVKNFAKQTEEDIHEVYTLSAEKYAEEVIRKTPVDQGFAKGSWSVGVNGNPKIFRERADKVGNFTVTRAKQAIARSKPGDFIRLATNIPYMARLEYGHSKQQPNGWIRAATARFRRMVRAAVREVRGKSR